MTECNSIAMDAKSGDVTSHTLAVAECSMAKSDNAMMLSGLALALAFIAILLMMVRTKLPGDKS